MNDIKIIVSKVLEKIAKASNIETIGSVHTLPCGLRLDRYNGGYKIEYNGQTLGHARCSRHSSNCMECDDCRYSDAIWDALHEHKKSKQNAALNEFLK